MAEYIRVHIKHRVDLSDIADDQMRFWSLLQQREGGKALASTISSLEGKLKSQLGDYLLSTIVRQCQSELTAFQEALYFRREMYSDFYPFRDRKSDQRLRNEIFANAFAKQDEAWTQDMLGSSVFQDARKRLAAAMRLVMSTEIMGYSSLDLGLSIGPIEKVVEVFEGNLDYFQIFLDAFLPRAFEDIFDSEFARGLDFSVQIPSAMADEFEGTPGDAVSPHLTASNNSGRKAAADYVWKIANGTLLLPVILALLVFLYGAKILSDIYTDQRRSVAPVLEHQLLLLEEDRKRLLSVGAQESKSGNIEQAAYVGSGDPNTRREVIVTGSFFKISGSQDVHDCQTRLPAHPVPEKRQWEPSREIKTRSGTMYHVVAEHEAGFDFVELRVRGQDGEWSNIQRVEK